MFVYAVGHATLPFLAGISFVVVDRLSRLEANHKLGLVARRAFGVLALTGAGYFIVAG